MIRNALPFAILLFLVSGAAYVWWQSGIPVIRALSERMNRRILKTGFIVGAVGFLAALGGYSAFVSFQMGLIAVFAVWFVDQLLRSNNNISVGE